MDSWSSNFTFRLNLLSYSASWFKPCLIKKMEKGNTQGTTNTNWQGQVTWPFCSFSPWFNDLWAVFFFKGCASTLFSIKELVSTQDGRLGGIDPPLKTDKQAGQRKTERERARGSVGHGKKARAGSKSCQEAVYGSKSRRVKSSQAVETQERETAIVCSNTTFPSYIQTMMCGQLDFSRFFDLISFFAPFLVTERGNSVKVTVTSVKYKIPCRYDSNLDTYIMLNL